MLKARSDTGATDMTPYEAAPAVVQPRDTDPDWRERVERAREARESAERQVERNKERRPAVGTWVGERSERMQR